MKLRYLKVLKESESVKPLGVTRIDGKVAGPGEVVCEDGVLGGVAAFQRYLDEKPPRVEEFIKNKSKPKGKGSKK